MKFRSLLPLPFLALLLLGGTASPVRADTLPPVSPTTSAHVDAYAAPGQEVTATWFAEDSGSDPLLITMSDSPPWPGLGSAAGWVQSVDPSQFALTSGQSQDVAITVDVPGSAAPGSYYVLIEASASDTSCTSGCIGVAVGGWLVVHVTA